MKSKLLAFFLLLLPGLCHAEPQEIPKINFQGGVDYRTACSEIDDTRACDSSNMINDRLGAAIKRNGSRRLIDIPISSNPVTSLCKVYVTSNTLVSKALIASSWDRIVRSTSDTNPFWVLLTSGLAHNQHYSFVTMNNKVLITGDKLQNQIMSYDVVNDTMGFLLINDLPSTTTILIQAKYHLQSRNYYITANVKDLTLTPSTTYYPSRSYYSLVAQPSSMTFNRFIDIRTNDGEEITGIGEMFGAVYYFKPSSIHSLVFTVLNLTANGGDQVLTPVVNGFGCIAPRTLANNGYYFIFLAKDGIRIYDGGRRARLNPTDESNIISLPIQPIINRIISAGTYLNASGIYYPKKQWYVFSYEDPTRSPRGRPNSTMIYDFPTGEWFPLKNWNAECFATQDGPTDSGDLLYGDSSDGYAYLADQEANANDARSELVLDTLDSTASLPNPTAIWQRGTSDFANVIEGSGSVKVTISASVPHSSMTTFGPINIGEFPDKSVITKNDKFSFRVFPSSAANITNIRMDLEVNDTTPNNDFDSNFTSVTIASVTLVNGNTSWTTITIPISSFPLLNDWYSLAVESFPFVRAQTIYGIRFDVTGIGDASVSFDDLRIVKATERPLEAYRLTKQWNFGTVADKRFRQVILNAEKGADSNISIDVFTNFGKLTKRIDVPALIDKQIFVTGFGSTENVTKLNSIDLSVIEATQATNQTVFAIRPLTTDSQYIYGGDQYNNRIIKIDKSSMSVFVSSYGSLGSGTTNFDRIYQIAGDDTDLYICDFKNNRIKKHRKETLEFVAAFGTLGLGATSYHCPTGVAVDENYFYAAQDGNGLIQKFSKSTGGYVTAVALNENTIGDTSLHVDEQYVFNAYNVLASTSVQYQEVILEQRNKSDLSLVNRVRIRPKNAINLSTYALTGDIGGSDQYVWICFTDNANNGPGAMSYIQKRLKSDLSIVREYGTPFHLFAVAHNGVAYNPKRTNIFEDLEAEGSYIQLKYVDSGLDNNMKLYSQSFAVISEGLQEK